MTSFSATVDAWVSETVDRTERVFKGAAQEVIKDAQLTVAKGGRMPVVSSNLRNSLVSGLNGSTSLSGPEAYRISLIAKLGDTIEGGWTMPYAMRIEFGFTGTDSLGRSYNQAPRFFLRGAAQKWPAIVQKEAAKAKARAGR